MIKSMYNKLCCGTILLSSSWGCLQAAAFLFVRGSDLVPGDEITIDIHGRDKASYKYKVFSADDAAKKSEQDRLEAIKKIEDRDRRANELFKYKQQMRFDKLKQQDEARRAKLPSVREQQIQFYMDIYRPDPSSIPDKRSKTQEEAIERLKKEEASK